jgi:hypothetical protein
VLQSIRIEGDILDWDGSVEIELGEVPTILTGRNGSGKTLTGNIIKNCTDFLRKTANGNVTEDDKIEIGSFFAKLGVEKVIFNFKNKFYQQYNNHLMTNLPILMTLDADFYPKCKFEKQCWELDMSIYHNSEIIILLDDTIHSLFKEHEPIAKINVNHNLIVDGLIDSLFDVELYDSKPHIPGGSGLIELNYEISLPSLSKLDFSQMTLDAIVEIKKNIEQFGLNITLFDLEFYIFEDVKNLKNMLDLESFKERIPKVSYYYPEFDFPKSITEWDDEGDRVENLRLEKDLSMLNVFFISTDRNNSNELEFHDEAEFFYNNYGYDDLSAAWGEKFNLPKANYEPDEMPKEFLTLLKEFWGDKYTTTAYPDGTEYRLLTEPENFDDLPEILKTNLHEFLCWHWWTWIVPDSKKVQIILHHEFYVSFDSLKSPLPSGVKNLALLIDSVMKSTPRIIFIDEPEISLHIDWQAKIIEILRLVAKRNKGQRASLIFTTHSPDIVVNNLQYVYHLPPHSS